VTLVEERKATEPWVPDILNIGTRGVRVKIWTFLFVNPSQWFTAQEIAGYLSMPLSTVQVALKDIRILGPRIESEDTKRSGKGRPKKRYRYQAILQT